MSRFDPIKEFADEKHEFHALVDGILSGFFPLLAPFVGKKWMGNPDRRYYLYGSVAGFLSYSMILITFI